MMPRILILLCMLVMAMPFNAHAQQQGLREEFETLANWKPLTFPKIPRHSTYSIGKENGKSILVATADNSASGIVYTGSFNIYQTPIIEWKWKISNIYRAGDEKKKSGDDYPIRVYVVFKYDPGESRLV